MINIHKNDVSCVVVVVVVMYKYLRIVCVGVVSYAPLFFPFFVSVVVLVIFTIVHLRRCGYHNRGVWVGHHVWRVVHHGGGILLVNEVSRGDRRY